MIIWLASYPRSGNTFLRSVLRTNFGLTSYSLYDDRGDIAMSAELSSVVGHTCHGLTPQKFYRHARASSKTLFVKTHDAPPDDAKAIYVVRDGRAAAVSYFHYLRNFTSEKDITLEDVISGSCRFGSWSEHVAEWAPTTRPNTLLLRYEELLEQPRLVIDRIAEFIGQPPINYELPKFATMQAMNSGFFRAGSNVKNAGELKDATLELFWLLHARTMAALGYEASTTMAPPALVHELVAKFRHSRERKVRRNELEARYAELRDEMKEIGRPLWWRLANKASAGSFDWQAAKRVRWPQIRDGGILLMVTLAALFCGYEFKVFPHDSKPHTLEFDELLLVSAIFAAGLFSCLVRYLMQRRRSGEGLVKSLP